MSDVRERLVEIGRCLREAKLASYSSPLPQEDYIEAQREIARGDYREAMNHLNQADQELDGGPNYTPLRSSVDVRESAEAGEAL